MPQSHFAVARGRILAVPAFFAGLPLFVLGGLLDEAGWRWPRPPGQSAAAALLLVLALALPPLAWYAVARSARLTLGPTSIRVGRRTVASAEVERADWDAQRQALVLRVRGGRPLRIPVGLYAEPEQVSAALRAQLAPDVVVPELEPAE